MGKISSAIEKSMGENWHTPSDDKRKSDHPKRIISPGRGLGSFVQSGGVHEDLITLLKPDSTEAEQFRKLGTHIQYIKSEPRPRSFLVTSAASGDGKTFLSSNLAISIAKSLEEPVLLMDCDLRAPSIHKKFRLRNVNGLSEHIIKGVDILPLIQTTSVKNLNILPAGSVSIDSAKLLSSNRMSKVLKSLKERNKKEFIIIDAPPPLLTAEAAALAKQVDAIILVVKYGHTPRGMVEELVKYLGKEKIFGIVLNQHKRKRAAYYKYGDAKI